MKVTQEEPESTLLTFFFLMQAHLFDKYGYSFLYIFAVNSIIYTAFCTIIFDEKKMKIKKRKLSHLRLYCSVQDAFSVFCSS